MRINLYATKSNQGNRYNSGVQPSLWLNCVAAIKLPTRPSVFYSQSPLFRLTPIASQLRRRVL